MLYHSVSLSLKTPDPHGIIQAKLGAFPFEGILEENLEIIGFISDDLLTSKLKTELIETFMDQVQSIQFSEIEHKNWNAEWERGFKEVIIDDFCQIRASFHPENLSVEHSICVDPKMAFGTGHHETTFMMVQAMRKINFEGNRVFDFGCGTGVLAILASKMGSIYTLGIDNSMEAVQNSIENAGHNNTQEVIWSSTDIADLKESHFDVILANINRNVLLEYMPMIFEKLDDKGMVVFSGILKQDELIIHNRISEVGLKLLENNERGEWLCLVCSKEL